jgi:hypothetical protein
VSNRDQSSCTFKKCSTVKGDGPYCPRHEFLVAQFGLEKAEGMECGYICPQCKAASEVQCEECPACEEIGCEACRKADKCCIKKIEELESEAEDLEDEADDRRSDASKIEAKMEARKKVAA